MRLRLGTFLASILLTTFSFPFAAPASTIRHDRTWDDYSALTDEYSSTVGKIYETTPLGTNLGSGTIITSKSSGTWILTAAHVVEDATSIDFLINNHTYSAESWEYYSYVTDDDIASAGTGDIGLIYIAGSIADVEPATLFDGTTSSLLGSIATFTGYGCTGDGISGFDENAYGTFHAVNNTLNTTAADEWGSSSSDSVLLSDFDSPPGFHGNSSMGSPTPLDLEGLTAPGDSGGGVFATIGGITYLVGVNSFGTSNDPEIDSDYGDIAGTVSVCDYLDWILGITGSLAPDVPGDANSDGVVDGSDVTILAGNWQTLSDATWSMGDFNGDGAVDGSDVTILAGNWQSGVDSSASAVPEPGTGTLLASLFLFFAFVGKSTTRNFRLV